MTAWTDTGDGTPVPVVSCIVGKKVSEAGCHLSARRGTPARGHRIDTVDVTAAIAVHKPDDSDELGLPEHRERIVSLQASKSGGPGTRAVILCRAAESGDDRALKAAAWVLEEAGRTEEAERLRLYGIEAGGRTSGSWKTRSPT
jgi:hypothetical protein